MKKKEYLKALFPMVLLIAVVFGTGLFFKMHPANEHPGMIRLHVIANSNSKEDQELKLKVRNEILKHMDGKETIEEARTYIQDNLGEIEEISDRVIDENGFDYTTDAELGVSFIPEKSYEDLTLPAGNYEALKVKLGKAEGENWWCVIFPQLCLIEERGEKEKLVLKSKIKEMLKEENSFPR